jgi:general secretion pathway protein E
MGLYEMFTFTSKLRKLVNASCDISELRQQTLKDGLIPLRLSGASKVAQGLTTIEEVLRVAPPPLDQ